MHIYHCCLIGEFPDSAQEDFKSIHHRQEVLTCLRQDPLQASQLFNFSYRNKATDGEVISLVLPTSESGKPFQGSVIDDLLSLGTLRRHCLREKVNLDAVHELVRWWSTRIRRAAVASACKSPPR